MSNPLSQCVGFEDGADGFVIHAEDCPNVGRTWIQGADCLDYMTWLGAWPDWARSGAVDDPTVGWPDSPVWWEAPAAKAQQ